MASNYKLEIKPVTPAHLTIELLLPAPPSEDEMQVLQELLQPLCQMRTPGVGVRIQPDGTTVAEVIRNLPSEISQTLRQLS